MLREGKHCIPVVTLELEDQRNCKGTIIYSHGNSSDLSHSVSFLSKFAAQLPIFNYVAYDYTGYGQSTPAQLTQDSICEDLDLLITSMKVPESDIILWGFSLGSYPTGRVAAGRRLKGVVLQSPLASIYSLFADKVSPYTSYRNDCFNLLDYIGDISSFLVIMHSKEDEVVPFEHSQALFDRHRARSASPFGFLLEVSHLGHNQMHFLLGDMVSNPLQQTLHDYLKLMTQSSQLPKAHFFQLQKVKYFGNLGDLKEGEKIDMEGEKPKSNIPEEEGLNMQDELSLSAIKVDREFEIDDVGNEIGA